jgi:hypothetical protein
MKRRVSMLIFGCVLGLSLAHAGDIEGGVTIQHTLTRRKVTLPAGQYDRGASVQLGATGTEDRLAFERTHVVIYLEGDHASPPVKASIEQKERQFLPDLVVIPSGSTVSFPNMDPISITSFRSPNRRPSTWGTTPKVRPGWSHFPNPESYL